MEENMLNAIYTLLTLDVVIAEILCIIFITIMSFRKELKTTQSIKLQLIMVSVICLLTLAEIILGIFTQESIIYIIWNIFILFFWFLSFLIDFKYLKNQRIIEDNRNL